MIWIHITNIFFLQFLFFVLLHFDWQLADSMLGIRWLIQLMFSHVHHLTSECQSTQCWVNVNLGRVSKQLGQILTRDQPFKPRQRREKVPSKIDRNCSFKNFLKNHWMVPKSHFLGVLVTPFHFHSKWYKFFQQHIIKPSYLLKVHSFIDGYETKIISWLKNSSCSWEVLR